MKSIFKKIVKVIMKGVKRILKIEEIKAEANAQVACKAMDVTADLIKSGANGAVSLIKSGVVDLVKSGAKTLSNRSSRRSIGVFVTISGLALIASSFVKQEESV